jgi:nucleotide-binding universal stress UspA family protein
MKKIITLFDVLNTPWHVLGFAIKIAKARKLPITGIFLEQRDPGSELKYPFPNDMTLTEDRLTGELISRTDALLIDDNIKLFKDECENEKVSYEIQKNVSIRDLINRTHKEDIIIADTKADFLEALLPKISCPVCLASENDLPTKLVLMLDEGSSSRNAIEKFGKVFPQLTGLPTDLVSINLSRDEQSANEEYIRNQLQPVFPALNIRILTGDTEKELLKFLSKNQENIMVVMGAFGRSAVSRFIRNSLATVILDKTRLSLFILHL